MPEDGAIPDSKHFFVGGSPGQALSRTASNNFSSILLERDGERWLIILVTATEFMG